MSRWSADIASVDAFAIAGTFGQLCPNARPCDGITNFASRDAGFAHENATVEHLLDLLRSSVLMAEQQWTEMRGIAHSAGPEKPLLAYTSGTLPPGLFLANDLVSYFRTLMLRLTCVGRSLMSLGALSTLQEWMLTQRITAGGRRGTRCSSLLAASHACMQGHSRLHFAFSHV